jgi:hypothetical protein
VSTYEKLVGSAAKRPAARTFKLLPEFFTETWGNRPTAPFEIGLRVPGEQDYRNALKEAESAQLAAVERAERDPHTIAAADEIGTRAYNEKLITFCVARGICNQHNVTLPHPYFELPDDELPIALKSNAIKRIFDEIERLAVDQSPVFAEATADDITELVELLRADDPFDGVTHIERARCLRYLRLVFDTITDN